MSRQLQQKLKAHGEYYLTETKNGKPRIITPAPSVMNILRLEKIKQAENRLKAGSAWSNLDKLIFTDELGSHLSNDTIQTHYKKLVASIGRPDARFHDLRHTYAVTALQEGDSIKTVQSNLGHATASFTLDVYGHVSEKMRKGSSDMMDAYIKELEAEKK